MTELLKHRLLTDLHLLGLPVNEVDFQIRPFSKTYYGRYFPVRDNKVLPVIRIYPYADEENSEILDYAEVLKTSIHEFCHHLQYSDVNFVRHKGCMHNEQFWRLHNHYFEKAVKMQLIGGEDVSTKKRRAG